MTGIKMLQLLLKYRVVYQLKHLISNNNDGPFVQFIIPAKPEPEIFLLKMATTIICCKSF